MIKFKKISYIWLLALMLTTFIIWAAYFEIDQAVRATAIIIPSNHTQVIQVADGGVLKDLLVKEGQEVKKGQLLALLEKERPEAVVNELRTRVTGLKLDLIRLNAAIKNKPLVFDIQTQRQWPKFVAAQQGLYRQRKAARSNELNGLSKSLIIIDDMIKSHTNLYENGDISKLELIRVQRDKIELETKWQAIIEKYLLEARFEIIQVEKELSAYQHRLKQHINILRHTKITSPTEGIIKHIAITTQGGVLRSGEAFIQISPIEEALILEAKIDPRDIGQLHTGLSVRIRFDALDSNIYGFLFGELTYLSPDTLSEQSTMGQISLYYRAHIKVDWTEISETTRIKPSNLKQGMSATIDILTGTRSVLSYLFSPIKKSFSGALIE